MHRTNGNYHLILWRRQIGCYDWDQDDNNDLIGCLDITLRQLIDAKESAVCTVYTDAFFLVVFVFGCDRSIALILMTMEVMTLLVQPGLLFDSC